MQGGIIQMVNHGISTGALFLIVGMIYDRRHTRQISDFGGLARTVPAFAVFFMITTLSSIGLPGLNGFVGEFLILLGAFETQRVFGVIATSGVGSEVFIDGVSRATAARGDDGINPGTPLYLVAILLGHESLDTTRMYT